MSRIDLSAHVRKTIPLIQAAVSRTVELQSDLAGDLPAIQADATQVQQIVMNLTINGAEAIAPGARGAVMIATRRHDLDPLNSGAWSEGALGALKPGAYVMLEIRDNGCGMDEPTKARIFEPFFTTKFTGRGLGLAAVLGIVRGHSGSIQVSSVLGQGTVFRVLFPALDAAVVNEPMPIAAGENFAGQGVVLVIDDEEIVRSVAKQALERSGYTVLLAEDGERGTDIFRRNRDMIRCVVLDATMPGMGAEETLALIKSLYADVPVILSSGFGEVELLDRFGGKGLADFLQKPYKSVTLVKKIRDVVNNVNCGTLLNRARASR
jgi:CheY-like chemotaxis protein